MAARKHPGPGSLPLRGVAASVVVAVRLTPAEAAALDALGPNRGESIRWLIAGGAWDRTAIVAWQAGIYYEGDWIEQLPPLKPPAP